MAQRMPRKRTMGQDAHGGRLEARAPLVDPDAFGTQVLHPTFENGIVALRRTN